MKRKRIGVASAYLSGLFFASFFTDKSETAILLFAASVVFFVTKINHFSRYDLYIIVFSFLTAFTASTTYTLHCYYDITDFAEQAGNFSGVVVDYEVYDGDRASYTIKGRINSLKKTKINLYTNELGADYGDTITLTDCTFKEFESDYLFDTKTWYKSRHIFLCVYEAEDIEVRQNNSALVKKLLVSFRENIIKDMRRLIGNETGGFLAGMIFGEKQYLDNNIKTSLYRSGIGHIFAVSGLHVSIIASIAMFIMRKLRVNKFVSFGMINLLFLFMVIITDYPISAIRAVLMLDIMYSAPLFRRQNDSLNSIAVVVVIISVSDPYIIYNSGFILSVCGTFGIAVFGKFMAEGIERKSASIFVSAVCTSLAVMPASMYYFDETSVVSPFSNIIIVPVCIIAMIFGLIYIISGGFLKTALYISDFIIKIVLKISDKLASIDFTHISCINDMIPLILILSGFAVLYLYYLTESKRIISVSIAVSVVFCSVVFAISEKFRDNKMIVAVLGKGNNSVVVVSYNGQVNIIDLSGHYRSAEYVRKYLSQNGTEIINTVFLTNKTASQDVIYDYELKPFRTEKRFAVNDIQIYNNRLDALKGTDFYFDADEYGFEYINNVLSINYSDCKVTFSSAKDNKYTGGLAVYYGNITKSTTIYENSIFLDDMNNFEIILSHDGEYEIRRLSCRN